MTAGGPRSLQARGYTVWLDVDCLVGSTIDAMLDAGLAAHPADPRSPPHCEPLNILEILEHGRDRIDFLP
jgi:hypothetical protein